MAVGGVHCFAGRRTVLFSTKHQMSFNWYVVVFKWFVYTKFCLLAQRLVHWYFAALQPVVLKSYNSAVQKQGPHIHFCQLQLKQAWTKLKRFGCLDSLQLARASRLHACNYSSKAESKQGGCYVCIREGNQHSDQKYSLI